MSVTCTSFSEFVLGLHLGQDSVDIGGWLKVDAILCDEVVGERGPEARWPCILSEPDC